jgi:hypothetical protein
MTRDGRSPYKNRCELIVVDDEKTPRTDWHKSPFLQSRNHIMWEGPREYHGLSCRNARMIHHSSREES